jgi:hypothetical protein
MSSYISKVGGLQAVIGIDIMHHLTHMDLQMLMHTNT